MSPSRPLPLPKLSFSLKVFLILFGILASFALASGLTFTIVQRQALKEQIMIQGGLMATMLSTSLEQGIYFEDRPRVEAAVQNLLATRHYHDLRAVSAYDANDGVLVRHITAKQGGSGDSSLADALAGALAAALAAHHHSPHGEKTWENDTLLIFTAPVSVTTDQRSRESLYFDTEVTADGKQTVIGYAQLALGKSQFDQEAAKIVFQTTILTLLFLVFAVAATYALTRDTLLPLQQLINTIRHRGGREEEEEEESLDLLGDAFSKMVTDLEDAFATIQDLKDGLESTVAKRTRELTAALAELRDTHVQLAQSEKMVALGRLVAGVAHEINNTTNFVSGALPPLTKRLKELETLLNDPTGGRPDPERQAAIFKSIATLLGNIAEGARRTNKIVTDLKNFSRPADEEMAPVDINHCLRTTCSLAYPEYKHRIDLTLELDETLPQVLGASGQLNQVFMNLLLNAVQAQPERGTLLLRSWRAGDRVHVLFHDSGPGIPAEVIDRIFEPFFTTKEVGKGTGLGLSISYGIIKKHQGEILVRSEPGRGAEFEIILPVLRQEALPEQRETEP
ncbi:MAG: sensor histidine kinase [Thermodesulfobacteriota bacterium]